jgi:hypothetical protein
MQKADTLIRTKLRLPFTRLELVSRSRLQEQIAHGLRGPLTLITAPAGFGKTTLVASCVADWGMPVACNPAECVTLCMLSLATRVDRPKCPVCGIVMRSSA